MPTISYTTTVTEPPEAVWEFAQDMDNWAPFLRGYESHQKVDERQSLWTLKGEVGGLSKATKFKAHVTEWLPMDRVTFTLLAVNAPLSGGGEIRMSEIWLDGGNTRGTKYSVDLTIEFGGILGPVINRYIDRMLSPVAEELANKIAAAVEARAASAC